MTDITVFTYPVLPENLSWDLSNPEVPYVEGGTLDITQFNVAQHFANGFIPSGTILGQITASGKLGPFLTGATDGRQTAVGILRASVQVVQPVNGVLKTTIGVAVLKSFGVVSIAKLPLTSAGAPLGGFYIAAVAATLTRIHFAA